jgi:hypothetical protein
MCRPVNGTERRRTVSLSLIGVIKPVQTISKETSIRVQDHLLVAFIGVCSCSSLDERSGSSLPETRVRKCCHGRLVGAVASVDKRPRCRIGELLEANCGLLCGYEGAGGVDSEVLDKVVDGNVERCLGSWEVRSSGWFNVNLCIKAKT